MGQAHLESREEQPAVEVAPARGGVVIPLFRGARAAESSAAAFAANRIRKAEVARRLQVSERTVERWVKEHELPCERPFSRPGEQPSGPVRFFWPHVEAWWRARCARGQLQVGVMLALLHWT